VIRRCFVHDLLRELTDGPFLSQLYKQATNPSGGTSDGSIFLLGIDAAKASHVLYDAAMDDSRLNPLHTAPLPPLVNASRVLCPAIVIKSNHRQLQHSSLSNPAASSREDALHDSTVLKPHPLSYPSTASSNPDPVIPSVGN
jgi:hypothetical protein